MDDRRPSRAEKAPRSAPPRLVGQSKRLSFLLRHGANEAGLSMDAEGWASVADVLRLVALDEDALREVVETNEKRRFEIDGARIRAVQGHSSGVPVSLEALEASWRAHEGDALVFHGTSVAAAHAILEGEGILPRERSHVHLAAAKGAKVGKRAQVDVVLVIDPVRLHRLGLRLFEAPNGVLLVRRVPNEAIVDVSATRRRAELAIASLRTLLRP